MYTSFLYFNLYNFEWFFVCLFVCFLFFLKKTKCNILILFIYTFLKKVLYHYIVHLYILNIQTLYYYFHY